MLAAGTRTAFYQAAGVSLMIGIIRDWRSTAHMTLLWARSYLDNFVSTVY